MAKNNLTWETEFDTVKSLMKTTFSKDVFIITDLQTGISRVMKNGEVVRTVEAMKLNPIDEMTKLCLETASDVEMLKGFKTE